jgi:imidazolonepropionase-like amidohydrolase
LSSSSCRMPARSGGWTDDTFVNRNQRPHEEIMKEMRLRHALVAYLFLGLFGHISIAQEADEHRPSRIIIHAAKLLEVKTGKTRVDEAIVIDGDKIVSVGPMAQVQRSTSDRLIDLPNATVLPGLTDAHTHLTGDPRNIGYQSLGISIPRATLAGARNARLTLEAGFTTVRNVGAEGYSDVALRDAINAGDIPGPRMLVSGPALGITGGHCDENLLPFEYHVTAEGVADGVEGVQHKAREVIKYGADLIKICATGGVLSKGDNPQASQYTLDEMKAIVADAHRLGRKVAAHAHGAQGSCGRCRPEWIR